MIFSYLLNMRSHPSWVCGLKQNDLQKATVAKTSHPSWVCGLKLERLTKCRRVEEVTPFVGVWIETICPMIAKSVRPSHTLRGCVD